MTAVSGQFGCAETGGAGQILELDGWSLDRSATLHEYATCNTPSAGGMAIVPGRRRHSGTLKGIQCDTNPIENWITEGAFIAVLDLYWTPTLFYRGSAYIENINIEEVDIRDGAPVRWSATFKAQGLFVAM